MIWLWGLGRSGCAYIDKLTWSYALYSYCIFFICAGLVDRGNLCTSYLVVSCMLHSISEVIWVAGIKLT